MKILHINTFDKGGAAKACIRLHNGLLRCGIDSTLLIREITSRENIEHLHTFTSPQKKLLAERIYSKLKRINGTRYHEQMKKSIRSHIPDGIEYFSFTDSGLDITKHPAYQEADIINLHWVADFVDYSFFKKNTKPVVWTIHDMNPFTGGCHYSGGCTNYLNDCTHCPILNVCEDDSYSNYIYKQKCKYITQKSKLSIVSPSQWLMKKSEQSPLLRAFPHHCIPNGFNSLVFLLHDKMRARQALHLPFDKKIILFVSDSFSTKRKGYQILINAMEILKHEDVLLCSVGSKDNPTDNHIPIKEFGHIQSDEKMSLIYSAADLFVIPSVEDNLPNTEIGRAHV